MKKKIIIILIVINIAIFYIVILNNYKIYKNNISKDNIKSNTSGIAMYIQKDGCTNKEDDNCYQELETNILPSGEEYTINTTRSYCTLDNKTKEYNKLRTNASGEHIISNLKSGEKCFVWFDKAPEKGITILAKLGDQTINFPDEGTKNPISVTCTNDVEAKFDYTNWELEIDAIDEGGTTCTVTFEEFTSQPFNTYLTNNAETLGLVEENGYRYEGTDSEVNNYVLFNDELWRIIGVFNVTTQSGNQDLVKLIRAQALGGLAWNGSFSNTWEGSSLQKSLNEGYLNKQDGTCNVFAASVKKTCNFSKTGISEGARNKIEAVKWNIGASNKTATAEELYKTEIVTQTDEYYKVGLMSASDYGYGVTKESCDRTTKLSSYNKSNCAGSNWLKNISYEWTLTPDSSNTELVLYVNSYGYVNYTNAYYGFGSRPSVYLMSNVSVLGGIGSRDLPYIIN